MLKSNKRGRSGPTFSDLASLWRPFKKPVSQPLIGSQLISGQRTTTALRAKLLNKNAVALDNKLGHLEKVVRTNKRLHFIFNIWYFFTNKRPSSLLHKSAFCWCTYKGTRRKKEKKRERKTTQLSPNLMFRNQNSNVWFSTDKFILRSNFKKNKFITNLIQFTSLYSQRDLVPLKWPTWWNWDIAS